VLCMHFMLEKLKGNRCPGFLFLISVAVFLSCGKRTMPLFGTYRIYSEDPSVKRWIAGENTYIKLNNDKTIVYNSTINGKQKFHFEGEFVLDEKTNTLTIQWKAGKLPEKMQIRKIGTDYVIEIG